jgi:hypothetical protein
MIKDNQTLQWYYGMRFVAFINCLSWLILARQLTIQTLLSGIYTAVCAYRSIFPKVDIERIVLIDNNYSGIFVGRLLATIAEIAFSFQISLFFQLRLIPCFITLAQCFCCLSVITLNPLWHIVEETIWMSSALYIFFGYEALYGKSISLSYNYHSIFALVFYITYMALIDIPFYVQKYKKWDGRFLNFNEGLQNSLNVRRPVSSWDFWKHEALWMTPYFSVAVWISQIIMVLNF